jgi:hypothetical protein
MEFSEATELLLAGIYDADKKNPGAQVDAGVLAKTLDINDATVIKDAVWALDERGLAAASFAAGSPQCSITAEGRALVETGGSTGIIAKFRGNPGQYIKFSSPPTPPAAAAEMAAPPPPQKKLTREELEEKLMAMRRALQRDVNLSEQEKMDAICDVDTLKAHFGRQKADKFIVEPLLARLGAIAALAAPVQQFTLLIQGSF